MLKIKSTLNLFVSMDYCHNCGSTVEPAERRRFDYVDLVGVTIVGLFVIGILSVFLFTSGGIRFFFFVGGFVAFGLYHMIGYTKKGEYKCQKCGHVATYK